MRCALDKSYLENRDINLGDKTEAGSVEIKFQNRRCIVVVQNRGDWKE
jgi:hypothetical protein